MTYTQELENIKEQFDLVFAKAPAHHSFVNTSGVNVSRSSLIDALKSLGYVVESTIHANGIGNNNENKIVKRIDMGNGYESEVVIGYFHYTYGIYARSCNYWFEDKDHTVIYSSRNCGEKVYSEDE